ncbi:MAG: T9SS type A sorting domain-containing protein [Chitinophagales bacterium]|nr:T9SS type A sorting domain-containing protein [Chitinophagales bacterium]
MQGLKINGRILPNTPTWLLVGLIFLSVTTLGQVATLPVSYSGAFTATTKTDPATAPVGFIWNQGANANNLDGVGGIGASLNTTSSYVQVNYNASANSLVFYWRVGGTAFDGIGYVKESSNGTNWTTVWQVNSPVANTNISYVTVPLNPASRYVRFERGGGGTNRIEFDGIDIRNGAGCTNTSMYPTSAFTAPAAGVSYLITSNGQWRSEYNQMNSVANGATYISSINGTTLPVAYITVRSGSSNGAIVKQGYAPLEWTATSTSNHFIHYTVNAACSTDAANARSSMIGRKVVTTACSGTFTDLGGGSANYGDNQVMAWTFFPTAGNKIRMTFSSFNTEANYDAMMIYDGNSTAAPVIPSGLPVGVNATTCPTNSWRGSLSGATLPKSAGASNGVVESTAADGSLTFVFTSDAATNAAGWSATISCIPTCTAPTVNHNLTGGGNYCSGGSGVPVGLATSQSGVTYQLYNGASPVGSTVAGTGGAISFGNQTAAGTYTVKTTTAGGYCATDVNGGSPNSVNVAVVTAPSASAGTAVVTCSNSGAVNITAGSSAGNYASVQWTSNGTGTWTNQNSLTTATYTPSAADIAAGSRTLTLIAVGNSPCSNATSTKTITINAAPTANAGSTINVPRGTAAQLSGSIGGGATGGQWSSNVAGTFSPNSTTLNATWLPSDPLWTGAATLTLTTTGAPSGCTNTSSQITVNVTTPNICAGVNVSATFTGGNGTNSYEVSTNSGGSWSAYTSGANINTATAGGQSVKIRATTTLSGCQATNEYTLWNIVNCGPVLSATTLAGFGNVCVGSTAGPNSFTITGSNLTTANVTVGPLTGYTFSTTSGGTYTSSLSLSQGGGNYSQIIYVKLTASSAISYSGNIPVGGGGASSINVAATGTGIAIPAAPTGTASQTFCTINSPTVANLTATGTNIKWYASSSGGSSLSSGIALVNGNHYYASQTVNGCESTNRFDVTVTLSNPAAPTGSASQVFCSETNPTVANLTATGSGIKWYATASGGSALAAGTALSNGTHYYASQTVSGCEGTNRFDVTVTLNTTAVPTPGTVVHPTCGVATGSVPFTNLPAGSWTLTASPGGATASGSGTTGTFSGLAANTYTFTVKNNTTNCTSAPTGSVTINTQPPTPSVPTVGTITPPGCVVATGSVALSNLPSSGNWTLTRSPGGTTYNGSGTTYTVTNLPAGTTYTFTVTNSFGCTSGSSAGAAIPSAPTPPSPSQVTTTYTCASGAVTLTPVDVLGANESYRWYNALTGGSVVSTANPFTPSINTTTNYYLVKYNSVSDCESSPRVPVVASKTGLDAYTVTRTTGISYSTIVGVSGTQAVSSWRSRSVQTQGNLLFDIGLYNDDNLSNTITPGFSFPYDGGIHTGFRVALDGFITFNTSSKALGGNLTQKTGTTNNCTPFTEPYTFNNASFSATGSNGTLQAIAPFYHEQYVPGTGSNWNSNVYYRVDGTSPNRILTVEWRNMREPTSGCGASGQPACTYGSLNYQVKLYEGSGTPGKIEFIYGTMNRGAYSTTATPFVYYTCGLNSSSLTASPTVAQLFTQQTPNSANFGSTAANTHSADTDMPASNSMITFTRVVPVTPSVMPTCVKYISPSNGATNQCRNQIISWQKIDGEPTAYDVYFGAGSLPGAVTVTTTNTYYDPGNLAANTTYYWKVVPKNAAGTPAASGFATWTFTTGQGDISPSSINSSNGDTICVGGTTTFSVVGGNLSSGSQFYWQDMESIGIAPIADNCQEGLMVEYGPLCPLLCLQLPGCPKTGTSVTPVSANFSSPGTYTIKSFVRGCNNVTSCVSKTITIIADPSMSAPTYSASSICPGGSTTVSSTRTGGTGTITYQWQYNTSGSTWINVGNGTGNGTPAGAVYGAPTTTGNTSSMVISGISNTGTYNYRCITTANGNGCGGAAASNGSPLTVVAQPSAALPSVTNATVCRGGSTVFSSTVSGGTGTPTYQWEYSSNGTSGWAAASNGTPTGFTYTNANTTSLSIGVANATSTPVGPQYYRLMVSFSGSGCNTAYSSANSFSVIADPVITNAAASYTFCTGQTAQLVSSSSGGTGSMSYVWQYDNAGTFADVSNGTPPGTTYSYNSATQTNNTLSITGLTVGTYTYRFRQSTGGALGCAANGSGITLTIEPAVTTPTAITVSGTEPSCQLTSAGTTTDYNSTTTVGTLQWSLSNIVNTVGTLTAGAINSSTGVVTWPNGWAGSVTINVVSTGCNGPSTAVTRNVTVAPTVTTPTAITVSGTEPSCQLTSAGTTTDYNSTATYGTLQWSLSNIVNTAGTLTAGAINSSTGVVTWPNGWAGSVTINVVSTGCNGPSTAVTRNVTVVPTVTTPTAITVSGTEPSCQLTSAGTTTDYNSTATYGTLQWSLTNITNTAGSITAGAINSSTGVVTWPNGWAGSVTINVVSTGCNGPSVAVTRVVTVHLGLSAPTAGTHTPTSTQIQWNWNTVSGATGYKYNTNNDFATATDNGISTSLTQTGLTCNTGYTLYVWAYNANCFSSVLALTETTGSCCTSPTIVIQPSSPAAICVTNGGTQQLTVSATGTSLTYSWRRNGTPVTNNSVYSGQGTNTLTLTDPDVANAGNYDVVITGACGLPVTSSPAVPVYVDQAIGSPVNVTELINNGFANAICESSDLELSTVTIYGGSTTYSWSGPNSWTANGQTVIRSNINENTGEGVYTVTVSNSCNANVTGSVDINVHGLLPGVVSPVRYYSPYPNQLTTLQICEGAPLDVRPTGNFPPDAEFSWEHELGWTETVSGSPLLSYQAAIVSAHSGYFSVTVSNACGSKFATGAGLTVYEQVTANADVTPIAPSTSYPFASEMFTGISQTDIEACGSKIISLTANTPGFGLGTWSLVGSNPGTVTDWGTSVNDPTISPEVDEYGSYVFRWTVENGACKDESDIRVTYTPPINITVEAASCSFIAPVNKDVIKVTASGGFNLSALAPVDYLEVVKPANDDLLLDVSTSNNLMRVFTADFDGQAHHYTVNDGVCAKSGSTVTRSGLPTEIATPINATTPKQGVCYDANFNEWLVFLDDNSDAIAAINDNGNNLDLGEVTVKVWVEDNEPLIPQNPNANNCVGFTNAALRRHFMIESKNYLSGQNFGNDRSISVRLFITQNELAQLITASTTGDDDDATQSCSHYDDVTGLQDLFVTKYSGQNENNSYIDNDVNGIYRVFGPNLGTSNGFANDRHVIQVNGITELSEFWLHGSGSGTPLPVEMLYLEANAIDNSYIQVKWATAVEIDNNGFQVERSVDAQNWSAIGWVDGNGNTTVQHNYHFNDYNVTAGIRYYYRLKQIDNDGDYEYTGIASAIINNGITFSVKDFIPNPATHTTTLFITSTGEQSIEVDIYNAIGQKMLSQRHTLSKGTNQLPFTLDQLAAGSYTAIVSSGNEVYSKKLIVVK